jgi:hypothetical protein
VHGGEHPCAQVSAYKSPRLSPSKLTRTNSLLGAKASIRSQSSIVGRNQGIPQPREII